MFLILWRPRFPRHPLLPYQRLLYNWAEDIRQSIKRIRDMVQDIKKEMKFDNLFGDWGLKGWVQSKPDF
ncbi:hypothetical protein HGM15179_007761 [Zosterops borbonicus]|uniref:Uncharacterized protein n=1 Tax=Zosterops borbonicus TaxID=364589 RepID=A0A8K1GKG3_9PASS|nr:hypothetical protein HGM15179_007761 [Zosterops borbonicus]